ncbi:MAG: DedA family protein [Candidatus Bathyarchaeota archaeon]|nr:DedA family protein [Candidatus Bathyarchaeota archaeon]
MVSTQRLGWLKKKAPLLIFVAIALGLCGYVLFILLTDTLVKGVPITSSPMISAIINFTHDVTRTISSLGYGGLFGLMVLEASSLPIPSEIILPFAGYLVYKGEFVFWLAVAVTTVAAVIGALIEYYIGLKGIQVLTKYRILGRYMVSERQIKVAADWFNKYGVAMVFLGRMVPVIRTLISFPAGAVRMPLIRFVIYTGAGSLIWNTLLIYGGYYLGSKYSQIADVSDYPILIIATALILAGAVFLVRQHSRKKTAVNPTA